jgi:hypothetical protein
VPRAGQDHAAAKRMEEHGIADPPLLYNQIVMHDGNMGRSPSKADPSQLEPKPQRFLEGGPLHCSNNLTPRHSSFRERDVRKNLGEIL